MSKKTRVTSVDIDFGVGQIIPSTQEAYQQGEFKEKVRKKEKDSLVEFKKTLDSEIDPRLAHNRQFPTVGEVFVFIVQYFSQESEYTRRDIDNMAKTVLDILKTKFYSDDSQVKTLLVGKKIEQRVPQNFAYIAIKKLTATQDVDAVKISGLERSVTLFHELKKRGLL